VQLYYAIQRICIQYATAKHKFPNEHIGVIFIQIDQHLKMLLKKYTGVPIFMKCGVYVSALCTGKSSFRTLHPSQVATP